MSDLEPPLSTCEREFILSSLRAGIRADARSLDESREVKIEFGAQQGTVVASIGDTKVMCVVSGDLVAPRSDRPAEGILQFQAHYGPMATPAHAIAGGDGGSFRAVELGRLLDEGMRQSRALDAESLCVLAGHKVWQVRVDTHVLDDAGNVLDCASLAAMTALCHFRRPDVTVNSHDNSVIIHSVTDKQPVPLALHHTPLSASAALLQDPTQETLVHDPSLQEELLSQARLTCMINQHGQLCCVQKSGGTAVDADVFLRFVETAHEKVHELQKLMKEALEKDKKDPRRSHIPLALRQMQRRAAEATRFDNTKHVVPVRTSTCREHLYAPSLQVKASEESDELRTVVEA
ncbi:MAG: hypothetical protein MHM6MM_005693 [Cercozoa sp. M6MM]